MGLLTTHSFQQNAATVLHDVVLIILMEAIGAHYSEGFTTSHNTKIQGFFFLISLPFIVLETQKHSGHNDPILGSSVKITGSIKQ